MSSSNIPSADAPHSEGEGALALTEELARDLQAAIAKGGETFFMRPRKPPETRKIPGFGDIYFGPLVGRFKSFAEGRPHYGMVKGPLQPEVPFAPATSQRKSHKGNRTLLLPLGTLPDPKRQGEKKVTVILLHLLIPIPQRQMQDLMEKRQMRYVQTLADVFLEEARAILARL